MKENITPEIFGPISVSLQIASEISFADAVYLWNNRKTNNIFLQNMALTKEMLIPSPSFIKKLGC